MKESLSKCLISLLDEEKLGIYLQMKKSMELTSG
jgi:hypothetical protein